MPKLSEPKMNALQAVEAAGEYRLISAGTMASLEKAGLVWGAGQRYTLTDAGREAIKTGRT